MLNLNDVVARRAVRDEFLDVTDRIAQQLGFITGVAKNVERQALGAFGADVRQLLQALDKTRQGLRERQGRLWAFGSGLWDEKALG